MATVDQNNSNTLSGSGANSAAVVVELGQQLLQRLDRMLSVLEYFVGLRSQGLPTQIPLMSDDHHSTERPQGSPYLNAQEAATYLGINVKSLYGLVERRQLKPLRGPKRVYRFTEEMLDEYLKGRR